MSSSSGPLLMTRGRMDASRPYLPKVDYHCHISITEYSDPVNPTIVAVSLEEFQADLQEAGFDKAVVLSDRRTSPEQVSAFVSQDPECFIGFG